MMLRKAGCLTPPSQGLICRNLFTSQVTRLALYSGVFMAHIWFLLARQNSTKNEKHGYLETSQELHLLFRDIRRGYQFRYCLGVSDMPRIFCPQRIYNDLVTV
ncbi:hypothetical protein CI102_7190 [Trichoderma harzianum]|nr:hypothetical protein CI102_7190 [Trichoderma harzianum]